MDEVPDSVEGVSEYLPKSEVYVNLMQPERMSRTHLIELFCRRGFGTLISPDDPFCRLVDLYYDHVMPMPQHTDISDTVNVKMRNGFPNSLTVAKETKDCRVSSLKRAHETDLDELVITSDPRRFTPGFNTPEANRAERVLTVRKPRGRVNDNGSSTIDKNNHTNTEEESPHRSSKVGICHQPENFASPKKRVKLKRDFTNLV